MEIWEQCLISLMWMNRFALWLNILALCKPHLVLCAPPVPAHSLIPHPHQTFVAIGFLQHFPDSGVFQPVTGAEQKALKTGKDLVGLTGYWCQSTSPCPALSKQMPVDFNTWMSDKWGVSMWTLGVILWRSNVAPHVPDSGRGSSSHPWGALSKETQQPPPYYHQQHLHPAGNVLIHLGRNLIFSPEFVLTGFILGKWPLKARLLSVC